MKAFGISALALSIVAIFIPIIGVFLVGPAGLAGFLAIFAAGVNLALGLSAVIINIVNILFLSPSLIIAASQQSSTTIESSYTAAYGILLSIQILAIIVFVAVGVRGYFRSRT
jgi:hypothetical protein